MVYKAELLHQSTSEPPSRKSAQSGQNPRNLAGQKKPQLKKSDPRRRMYLLPPQSKTSIGDGGFPVNAKGEGEAHEQCTTVPSGYDGRVDPIIAAFGLGPVVGTTGGGRSSSFGARAACR
jgi:hypothetical protein